jgi:hypothetical protein
MNDKSYIIDYSGQSSPETQHLVYFQHVSRSAILALIVIATFLSSCKNQHDDDLCVKVHYVSEYCAEQKPLHLVRFLEPNRYASSSTDHDSTVYWAAMIDLPKGVQKTDSTFYMYFHYNKKLAKSRKPSICQALFSTVNILVCDMVTIDPCKIPL